MPDSLERLGSLMEGGFEPSWITELLRHSLRYGSPPPERRVFVNRTLRMQTIRHVGFDLDFTLADYEREPIERTTFELAIERLIDDHGYPESIRRAELRPDFPRRGLLIDKRTGTVLRMNRHRYVGQAYLGRRKLSRNEMIRLFRNEPLRPSNERFYHVDSLFELPETNLYAELIELREGRDAVELPEPERLFEDVRAAVDQVHATESLQRAILDDPGSFLSRGQELPLTLLRLALSGRRLILLTNAGWSFADRIGSYLFDESLPGLDSWRRLFDLIVVRSGKPGFFRKDKPFVELDPSGEPIGEVQEPAWGGIYQGGNLGSLMRLLDCRGEEVLYVGDHIYGDIVTSKRKSNWRTALIVRELEEEFHRRAELSLDIAELTRLQMALSGAGHQMDQLSDVLTLYRKAVETGADFPTETFATIRSLLEGMKDRHHGLLRRASRLGEEVAESFNPYWGSFFKQGGSKTLFANQLEAFACIYTSRVVNLGLYGTNHYYRVIHDPMMHDWDSGTNGAYSGDGP